MISIIGSTGSIGVQGINVARRLGLKIGALTAFSNLELLKKQADEFRPKYVGVIDDRLYNEAKTLFSDYELVCGKEALIFSCSLNQIDTVLISVVGLNGIFPLIDAIKNNKKIALANKESIVAGGKIIHDLIKKHKANIIPVDSEHNAIYQCLHTDSKQFNKLILTASGGAFYNKTIAQLKKIAPKDIFHPNWSMGRKITIDSCTMMNKALEIIEARWLFDTTNIDYCIHPNSIIHSMVEFNDGSVLAQMSNPTMELPIQYALTYPHKMPSKNLAPLDLTKNLLFAPKREDIFIAPQLALELIASNNLDLGIVFNAANEKAVSDFEAKNIGFMDIQNKVADTLKQYSGLKINSIDDIINIHNDILGVK